MVEHVDRITQRPESYTRLLLPRSFIGAAAQRATENLARAMPAPRPKKSRRKR